jgi:hypothetical protein
MSNTALITEPQRDIARPLATITINPGGNRINANRAEQVTETFRNIHAADRT